MIIDECFLVKGFFTYLHSKLAGVSWFCGWRNPDNDLFSFQTQWTFLHNALAHERCGQLSVHAGQHRQHCTFQDVLPSKIRPIWMKEYLIYLKMDLI